MSKSKTGNIDASLKHRQRDVHSKYPGEVAFIEGIRSENQTVGAYTLARQIAEGQHGNNASGRGRLSILSVIRRYDAKVRELQNA